MGDKVNWYILFVKTGREKSVERILKRQINNNKVLPFIPMMETIFKRSGCVKKELKPLFPGYLFIESELSSIELINSTRNILVNSKDFIHYLKYGDTNEIALKEQERSTLLRLYNCDNCIESSKGIIIGNRVYIKEGPLKGLESIVTKIDRHKMMANIELFIMGATRQVCVALEIIEKI